MSDSRCSYEIRINDANNRIDHPTYVGKYTHKPGSHFVVIPVAFTVNRNSAYIRITDSDSSQDKIMRFSADEIRDTMRKVYLYHLLHFGQELSPNEITLILNGHEYIFDHNTPNFPFMFSMIHIPSDFDFLPFEDKLIIKIIKESKTQQFKRDEYACLFAFLGGLGKELYNDQFIYFWTAINSYYNLIAKEYNKKLTAFLAQDSDYQNLSEYDKSAITRILSLSGDEKNMHALSLLFSKDPRITKAKHTKLNTDSPADNTDNRSAENTIIVTMSTWFNDWNDDWAAMLSALKNPNRNNRHLLDLQHTVFDRLKYSKIDAYAWVTFKFPYVFRCSSIHGSRAYLAFAGYNEPELKLVSGMCYAMRDFLNENIKNIFKDELLTDNDCKKIRFMCANYLGFYRESYEVQNYLRTKCNAWIL